jgi:hypothetical protein
MIYLFDSLLQKRSIGPSKVEGFIFFSYTNRSHHIAKGEIAIKVIGIRPSIEKVTLANRQLSIIASFMKLVESFREADVSPSNIFYFGGPLRT